MMKKASLIVFILVTVMVIVMEIFKSGQDKKVVIAPVYIETDSTIIQISDIVDSKGRQSIRMSTR